MSEYLWPPDIVPSAQDWRVLGNVASFESPFTGSIRTVSRSGGRLGCRLVVPPLKGTDRYRLMSILAALRDRSNYLWVPDFSTTRRGSFPESELFTNNDFSNGATGWSAGAVSQLTVQDRVARVTAVSGAPYQQIYQSVTPTQYAPYALRSMFNDGHSGLASLSEGPALVLGSTQASAYGVTRGYRIESGVYDSASANNQFPFVVADTSGFKAGDWWDIRWTSLARCILADAGPNALIQSTALEDTGAWGRSQISNITSGGTAPDGTATARSIIENGSAGSHYIAQSVAVAAAAADFTFSVYLKVGTRGFGYIQLVEATGGTAAYSYLNLSSGSWDSEATGANWSNLRKRINDCGNGWYRFSITARKTNGATTISVLIGIASAANTGSYTGDGASYIQAWGASLAQSGVPVRYVATTATATTGTSQTGSTANVKGLPVSTSGLLKSGDFVSCGNQGNIVVAPLDSDAAGLGVLQCALPWRAGLADNTPIIVHQPLVKMRPAGDIAWPTGPGQFSSFEIDLVEDIT